MSKLFLVRHAKPAASWGQDADPGLDPLGVTQAKAAAERLVGNAALPIYSSPLRRCRETAAPLEAAWRTRSELLPAVAEIPAPPLSLAARQDWLMRAMQGTWRELHEKSPAGSPDYLSWRQTLLDALRGLEHDCVIFTHFIAINVVVAAARSVDNVVCFRPDHASVTMATVNANGWRIEELGREAETSVLAR